MTSALRASLITVVDKLGVFDVVLPFLLVFTIVFAILEKTKIFGTEKVGDQTITKKNLNATVAFVIAFFVVASNKLVQIITETTSNAVILLIISILFLILVGSFHKEEAEGFFLQGGWATLFTVMMFIGLALIFLNSMHTSSGESWLELVFEFFSSYITPEVWAGILFIALMGGAIFFVTASPKTKEKKEE